MIYIVSNHELQHHGIKGQKWYVRRYQNEDGSLTEAGKIRYGYGDGSSRRQKNLDGKSFDAKKAEADAIQKSKKQREFWNSIEKEIVSDKSLSQSEKKIGRKLIKLRKDESVRAEIEKDRINFFKDPNKAKKDMESELNLKRKSLNVQIGLGRTVNAVGFLAVAGMAMSTPVSSLTSLLAKSMVYTSSAAAVTSLMEKFREKRYSDFVRDADSNENAFNQAFDFYNGKKALNLDKGKELKELKTTIKEVEENRKISSEQYRRLANLSMIDFQQMQRIMADQSQMLFNQQVDMHMQMHMNSFM